MTITEKLQYARKLTREFAKSKPHLKTKSKDEPIPEGWPIEVRIRFDKRYVWCKHYNDR